MSGKTIIIISIDCKNAYLVVKRQTQRCKARVSEVIQGSYDITGNCKSYCNIVEKFFPEKYKVFRS